MSSGGSPRTFFIETLGCPKNAVDSDKLAGSLLASGYVATEEPGEADLVVVNTCAFIDAARQESVDTVLSLLEARRDDAKVVVTGCMAERYGEELAEALPEVDLVAGFGVPVTLTSRSSRSGAIPSMDLLNLPRPKSSRPWAYVKIAEGCDRKCGFCAIPSFRGRQRSRAPEQIMDEVEQLDVREVVLVAQDLASYGRDRADLGAGAIVDLVQQVAAVADRTRLLYLYPSDLSEKLVDVIGAGTGVPYYDLSLQHVSRPLLRRMRRWGDGARFLERIEHIRERYPDAAFRSNFIVGYPGETEDDHDELVRFIEEAQLDWVGFFAYSREDGTHAAGLDGEVPDSLVEERLQELRDVQDEITFSRRRALVGTKVSVLVDRPGIGRGHREAPEIDGVVEVPPHLPVGDVVDVQIVAAFGPDLRGEVV